MVCLPMMWLFLWVYKFHTWVMVKKYDNEFKVMIAELLNSGSKTKQISEDYDLSLSTWQKNKKYKYHIDFQSLVEH